MQKKLPSLDLARGFTVLIMAPVHTMLLYSLPAVRDTPLGHLFGFLAEGPGAPLFMTLMGIFFAFSAEGKPFSVICKRAVALLILAYALNTLKFVIPLALHRLPQPFMADLGIQNDLSGLVQVFLLGDILHFAALTLPILWLVTRLPHYHREALLLTLILIFLSPATWDRHTENPFVNYLLTLSGGQPPQVFFPLLPWLVYPLAGLVIGHYLKGRDPFLVFGLMGCGGTFLMTISFCFPPGVPSGQFYRPAPGNTLYHLGFVLVWLYLCHYLSQHIPKGAFVRLLGYLSRNITQVYVIQWVVICWLLPVFGYQDLGLLASVGCIILTTVLTLWFSITLNLLRPRRARKP